MSKKLPITDFRAARSKLEPDEFAISQGQDVAPSDLIEHEVWDGMMHLPAPHSDQDRRIGLAYLPFSCLFIGAAART
jgi:hypothetical protein